MNSDSYWAWRDASPPELFGEPDGEEPTAAELAAMKANAELYEPDPKCEKCGEDDRPCACDIAAYHKAFEDTAPNEAATEAKDK